MRRMGLSDIDTPELCRNTAPVREVLRTTGFRRFEITTLTVVGLKIYRRAQGSVCHLTVRDTYRPILFSLFKDSKAGGPRCHFAVVATDKSVRCGQVYEPIMGASRGKSTGELRRLWRWRPRHYTAWQLGSDAGGLRTVRTPHARGSRLCHADVQHRLGRMASGHLPTGAHSGRVRRGPALDIASEALALPWRALRALWTLWRASKSETVGDGV